MSPAPDAGTDTAGFQSLEVGSVLADRYEILAPLGYGGMGSVFKVFDRELERTVALKTLRPELTGNANLLRRLKQETLLARQIGHPNVVRVFDLGVAGRLRFITMEFVDGEDLRTLLDQFGKLSPNETIAIAKQLCLGLQAAHAEDVTHRDLKPRNILIGRDNRVRIVDFGLARSLEETGLTRTGAIIGTPDYMAPEQALSGKSDARSDIFSLGVVLYECLTGELPYTGKNIADSFLSRTRKQARSVSTLEPSLPGWLAAIVMRCLERIPDQRFQSAREVLNALNAQEESQPSSSHSGSGVFEPGTMLGSRYRVEALAGEGGMGKVYRATDLELDRTVALKVVHPDLAANPNYLARLRREISLASQVSHANVLRVHDLGEVGGVRFVSMAWAEGQDLAQLLRELGTLPEAEAVRIGIDICQGLAAAHALGVVHRDLKPSNVLLDANDQACVADFGVAIGRTPAKVGAANSAAELVGTPRYMSPEQAERKPVDARTDIYSLGLILYEMVTGTIPFRDDSVFQTLALRVSDAPKSPKSLNPAISDAFAAVVMRCLERDPEKRYPAVTEVLSDLRRLQTKPVEAATPRRRKILLAASALLLFLVVAGIAAWWMIGTKRTGAPVLPAEASIRYIAVLPFRVLSSDPNVKYEAEGIADAVTARLSSLDAVHPVSGAALERAEAGGVDSIAQQVGANLVVVGTLQAQGDHLYISVRLEDVAQHRANWSQTFTGVRQDLFTLEDQIASAVVNGLKIAPTIKERERQPMPDTQDLSAYDLYLKGRDTLTKQRNVSGATEALKSFEAAVDKDDGFALAWTGIADASVFLYRSTHNSSWAEKGLLAAREAAQRNQTLPEVHFALGSVYSATGKNTEAIEEIKRALKLAPNSDDGYIRLARAYLASGQTEAAIQAAIQAVQINPYYFYNHKQLGFIYQRSGHIADAVFEFNRAMELNPHDSTGYLNLGAMLYLKGDLAESIPWFKKAIAVSPTFDAYANLGTVYYQLARYKDAIAMTEKAVELNPNSSAALRNLAQIYAAASLPKKASQTYDRAIEAAYKVLQVNPRNADELGTLAMCYGGKGDYARAHETLVRARNIDPSNRDLLYDEAVLDAQSGRLPNAIQELQTALEHGSSFDEASRDPALADLRRMPEFADLQKRFGKSSSPGKQ